ncbi:MAG: hypothetical protein R2714_02930 [Microthrixaceae bacterium]
MPTHRQPSPTTTDRVIARLVATETARSTVAPRVHGGGQHQRTVEGIGCDGHHDVAQQMRASTHVPAESSRPVDALGAHDELWGDRERHRDRHRNLVERWRHRGQEPLRVGEHVRRSDADEQCGQPQTLSYG